MKICIVRNAESRTNASIIRVLDALLSNKKKVILLTRSRYNEKNGIIKKHHIHEEEKINNYEINIKGKTGRGFLNIFNLIYYQFVVFKWLLSHKEEYDVIHSFDLDAGLPVLLVSKISNKKYVYHIADFYVDSRGGIPNILKKVIKKIEFMIIRNAEATIICTEERREQIKGSKPKKLTVVHNTPSKDSINKEEVFSDLSLEKENDEKITFTYVGALSESRFIKTIIDVFKLYPEFRLELAGMGKMSDYAKEASISYENINYYGRIDYEEALNLYSKADVMFAIYDPNIRNHKYSAPNKVYEAMIKGKPIIVAKNTSVDKIVEKEKMGFIIDYTRNDFENILSIISNDESILKAYGNNARKTYEKYSWDIMKKRLTNIYENINI